MERKLAIALNYLSEAVKILTVLFYTPLMLRLLGRSEFGLYQMVSSVVSHLSLLSLGFSSAYVRSYCRYQEENDIQAIARLNGMFALIFSVMAGVCLLCGGILTVNAQRIFGTGLTKPELARAKCLLMLLVGNMSLTFPNSVFDCYITARERFVFQKLLKLAQALFSPFLTLPLLLLGYGSGAVAGVSAALTLTGFLINGYYCIRNQEMAFSFRNLPLSSLRELWGFTFFIFLNQIIDRINWSVDKFLLGRMSGTESAAVYGVGAQIHTLYLHLSTAISGVFGPRVHRIAAQNQDNRKLTQLMIRVGRVQLCVLGLVLTGFFLFGRAFLGLWAGEGYGEAYGVALLLMLPMTVPLIQNLGIEIQRARNQHRARSVVYFCLAMGNVGLSILLIPRWGCTGAAAGTAVTQILGTWVFMNWYYHRRLGLDMISFWKGMASLLPPLLLSFGAGLGYAGQVKINSWGMLLLSALAYTAVYGILMWRMGLQFREKQSLLQFGNRREKTYGISIRKHGCDRN